MLLRSLFTSLGCVTQLNTKQHTRLVTAAVVYVLRLCHTPHAFSCCSFCSRPEAVKQPNTTRGVSTVAVHVLRLSHNTRHTSCYWSCFLKSLGSVTQLSTHVLLLGLLFKVFRLCHTTQYTCLVTGIGF